MVVRAALGDNITQKPNNLFIEARSKSKMISNDQQLAPIFEE